MQLHKQSFSVAALLLAGCGAAPTYSDKCSTTINPTADATKNHAAVQTALGNAMPGAVICLAPGAWPIRKELALATDNVTLSGAKTGGEAVLDFAGQREGPNGINVVANGFKIQDLTVKNTPGDAIRVTQAKGVKFIRVKVTWDAGRATSNGAYGLYPVECSDVLIDHCSVSYAADAGIYVGQSRHILVKDCEAFGNVAGIEIENSEDSEVVGNYAHDNTGGILVFDMPDLKVKRGGRSKVHGNRILGNNGMNFAAKSGIVSIVPSGTGLLILSSDDNEIHNNEIHDNDSTAYAVVSFYLTQRTWVDKAYDPYPEGNYVHDNRFSGNGQAPSGLANTIAALLNRMTIEDMVWDGMVDPKKMNVGNKLTNCVQSNGAATYRNLGVDDDGKFHATTDVAPVTCSHDPLPPITL